VAQWRFINICYMCARPQLAKRKEAKEKAKADLEVAEARIKAAGEDDAEATKAAIEEAEKLSKRTVHMNRSHQDEAKHLLRLMGVPVVEAPCEAEAQCAALAKAGVVWAAASEDMDTLCFGAPRLLRRLTFSEARKLPVWQIELPGVLSGAGLTMEEFVDVCILCGCDYLEPLKGIGPKKALDRVRKHGDLESVIAALRSEGKIPVPEGYPIDDALRLFHEADVADPESLRDDIKWTAPDEEGLVDYLVEQKGFNVDRVRNAIVRLKKARTKGGQRRMDAFFTSGKPKAAAAKGASSKPARGKATVASKRAGSKPVPSRSAARTPATASASASASAFSPVSKAPAPAEVAAGDNAADEAAATAEEPAAVPPKAVVMAPMFFASSQKRADKRPASDMDSAPEPGAKKPR